jgi:hypothetical protein
VDAPLGDLTDHEVTTNEAGSAGHQNGFMVVVQHRMKLPRPIFYQGAILPDILVWGALHLVENTPSVSPLGTTAHHAFRWVIAPNGHP